MKERQNIEQKESEPQHNIVIVDFVRHGSTEYLENATQPEARLAMQGKFPRDLTPKGELEVQKAFEEIIARINPSTDIVVLWSSPAWRAQGSEEIAQELLEKHGIQVYRDSSIKSMRNFDQHDLEYMKGVWELLAPTKKAAELAYARDPEFQVSNDKFESQPEVAKRAARVFNRIRYLAEHAKIPAGKRLRIIGVSHFEFLNPIIEDLFGPKVDTGVGVNKGEGFTLTFDYEAASKEMRISSDFRGEHKDDITFDKDKRTFLTAAS